MLFHFKKLFWYVFAFILASLTVIYIYLYFSWYQYQSQKEFHFFNDAMQWYGLDKLGHFTTAFFESWICIELVELLKVKSYEGFFNKNKHHFIFTGLAGFFFQLPIEIMDGFSHGYGFSIYDCLANFLGCVAVIVQYLCWKKVKIIPKFSFIHSSYAPLRPNLLGHNWLEQFIKDYNGQTYWISFSPNILKKRIFPQWFNLAIGFGANGLLGGDDNVWNDDDNAFYDFSTIQRMPQVYLSFDINMESLPINSKMVKYLLQIFNIIKIPLPYIEINPLSGFTFILF